MAVMRFSKSFIAIALSLLIPAVAVLIAYLSEEYQTATLPSQSLSADRIKAAIDPAGISYVVGYERYGIFGLYHVSMFVDAYNRGMYVQRLHIDGAGRFPKWDLNLGVCNFKLTLLPPYLAGHVNPQGHKKHFLGLITSREFGPLCVLNEAQGTKFLNMAHHAVVFLNTNDTILYFTFPGSVGPWEFWTSNSVVASLVKNAKDDGIKVSFPVGGYYPGFYGPFLPKSLYE